MLTKHEIDERTQREFAPPEQIITPYKVYPTDGKMTEHIVTWPEDPPYDVLRRLVNSHLDGGMMERVRVFWAYERGWTEPLYLDMFVDFDGQRKMLPRNDAATKIYRNNVLVHDRNRAPDDLPAIYGPAVLFSRRVWF